MNSIRQELNQKYYKLPNITCDNIAENDKLVLFYSEYKRVLMQLINEVNLLKESTVVVKNTLNNRQVGSVLRCVDELIDGGWDKMTSRFSQAYYEIIDFIYYPQFEYNELSLNEIGIIIMMATYLVQKADDMIEKINNGEYIETI